MANFASERALPEPHKWVCAATRGRVPSALLNFADGAVVDANSSNPSGFLSKAFRIVVAIYRLKARLVAPIGGAA